MFRLVTGDWVLKEQISDGGMSLDWWMSRRMNISGKVNQFDEKNQMFPTMLNNVSRRFLYLYHCSLAFGSLLAFDYLHSWQMEKDGLTFRHKKYESRYTAVRYNTILLKMFQWWKLEKSDLLLMNLWKIRRKLLSLLITKIRIFP